MTNGLTSFYGVKTESGCFDSTVHEEILLPGNLGNRGQINTQKRKGFPCLQLVGVENLEDLSRQGRDRIFWTVESYKVLQVIREVWIHLQILIKYLGV